MCVCALSINRTLQQPHSCTTANPGKCDRASLRTNWSFSLKREFKRVLPKTVTGPRAPALKSHKNQKRTKNALST